MDSIFPEIERARELAEGGELEAAIEILLPLMGAGGEIGREASCAVAYCYHAAGESARALSLARELTERYPFSPDAHLLFGGIASDLGQYKEAESALRRAVRLDAEIPAVHFQLALLHHRVGRHAAALRDLRRALALGHDRGETEALRGEVLFDLDRLEEALRAFQIARRHAPDRLDIAVRVAAVLGEMRDLGRAWEECIAALRRDADYGPAYFLLASIRERQGLRDEARILLRNAIQLLPKRAEPYLELARSYLNAGSDAQAAEVLDACAGNVEEEGLGEEYILLRGIIAERASGPDVALSCVRDFLRVHPAQSWELLSLYRRLAGEGAAEAPIWEVRIQGSLPDRAEGLRGFRRRLWIAAPSEEEATVRVRDLLHPLALARFSVTCRMSSRPTIRQFGPYQCGEYGAAPDPRPSTRRPQRRVSTTPGGQER